MHIYIGHIAPAPTCITSKHVKKIDPLVYNTNFGNNECHIIHKLEVL